MGAFGFDALFVYNGAHLLGRKLQQTQHGILERDTSHLFLCSELVNDTVCGTQSPESSCSDSSAESVRPLSSTVVIVDYYTIRAVDQDTFEDVPMPPPPPLPTNYTGVRHRNVSDSLDGSKKKI